MVKRERKKKIALSKAPEVPGTGSSFSSIVYSRNPEQEALFRSNAALWGRTTYFSGPTLDSFSTYPASGLTPQQLGSIFQQVKASGYMQLKADLDEQIMQRDPHLSSIDRSRRVGVTARQFKVKPFNASPLAVTVSKFMQAVVENIENFRDACYELLQANASGMSISEIIWDPNRMVRFPVEGSYGKIYIPTPIQIDWIHNKHLQFDIVKDSPLLNQSGGYVDIAVAPDKFIYHVTTGSGQARCRGFMYPCSWYHMQKQIAIARWDVALDLFGIPSAYIKNAKDIFENPERRAQYELFAQQLGQGQIAITTDDLDVNFGTTPQGLDARGMHAALIGLSNAEMSKCVLGSTLTVELSQTGSYNAAAEHAMVKESIIRMDSENLANTIRSYLFKSILRRAIYSFDEEGNIIGINPKGLCAVLQTSPEEIMSVCPRPAWRVERDSTPEARMQILEKAVALGIPIDVDSFYEEFGFDPPKEGSKPIPGTNPLMTPSSEMIEETTDLPIEQSAV